MALPKSAAFPADKTTENQIAKNIIFNEVNDFIKAPERRHIFGKGRKGGQIENDASVGTSRKDIK
jgi:hypothetical protein